MKKKKISLLTLEILILLGILFFASRDIYIHAAIRDFNRNATLPIGIAVPTEKFGDTSSFTEKRDFGFYTLSRDGIRYTVKGGVDGKLSFCTTCIEITSPAYSIFGISVGDSLPEQGERAMRWAGYHKVGDTDTEYRKGDLSVLFSAPGGCITKITVTVKTNLPRGIMY